jgi:ribosomal protein L7Ae-like RNA K-turn-binding protein
VVADDGQVVPDLASGAFGRGAWVHPRTACLTDAARGGLSRGLKTKVVTTPAELVRVVREAATRRVVSLLQAAQRARLAALGTTALEEAERDDRVELLVLAHDAKASAALSPVLRLGQRGRVRLFLSKSGLGAAFKRDELALVALLSPDLSREVARMISVSELEEPGRAHRLTEVG